MTKISRSFRTIPFLKTAVASIVLTACSGVSISTPAADAVVAPPALTHVEITSKGSLSNVTLSVDGNDVSNQVSFSGATHNYVADLTLAAGLHTLVATADANCSYCTGGKWRASDTRKFCVAGGAGATNKTMFAQSDNQGWARTSDGTAAIAADGGLETKWMLIPKATGLGSPPGTIMSAQFPCVCLRSPNINAGAVLELAPCDATDNHQVFDGNREQTVNGVAFYQFTNASVGAFHGCLTEGNAADGTLGKLVQQNCNAASNQLWSARNNTTNVFDSGQYPW